MSLHGLCACRDLVACDPCARSVTLAEGKHRSRHSELNCFWFWKVSSKVFLFQPGCFGHGIVSLDSWCRFETCFIVFCCSTSRTKKSIYPWAQNVLPPTWNWWYSIAFDRQAYPASSYKKEIKKCNGCCSRDLVFVATLCWKTPAGSCTTESSNHCVFHWESHSMNANHYTQPVIRSFLINHFSIQDRGLIGAESKRKMGCMMPIVLWCTTFFQNNKNGRIKEG